MPAQIASVFSGGPKALTDADGTWLSSIQRERVYTPVRVEGRGIPGDSTAQPYHGSPDAALCVHVAAHYYFWRDRYGLDLAHGSVGENFTLAGLEESSVFVGDVVRCGSVLAQVSGPRVPCANLARHIGQPDWVRLTVTENRTGFYMRVLQPGTVQAGDAWTVEDRPGGTTSIPAINRCMYLSFDAALATRMLDMAGLGRWWREQAAEKLAAGEQHWTSRLGEG